MPEHPEHTCFIYLNRMTFRINWILILILACVAQSSAWTVQPSALQDQPMLTRESQLREFDEAFKPAFDSYLGFGWMLLPKPDQSRLQGPYGEQNGFAFRHRFAFMMQRNPDTTSPIRTGAAWWVERQGFETEDFLAFPNYSDQGLVREIHTFALLLSNTRYDAGVAAGLQWQHPEHVGNIFAPESDSLWWFGHATWGKLSVQTLFHRTEWDHIRASFNLGSRAVLGSDSVGVRTYLPDLSLVLRHDTSNPLCISASQNLWHQMLYLTGSWYPQQSGERFASLKVYGDGSHLVGAEFGVRHFHDGTWTYGVGIEAPFVRISCNLPREYDQFFKSRGNNVLVEFYMSIEAIAGKSLFALNAPRSAPLESTPVKKKAGSKDDFSSPDNTSKTKTSGGAQ